jgi:hypothetical protein
MPVHESFSSRSLSPLLDEINDDDHAPDSAVTICTPSVPPWPLWTPRTPTTSTSEPLIAGEPPEP